MSILLSLWAQSPAPAEADGPTAADGAIGDMEELVRKSLALDIASAGYYSLVDWARSLGLATTGSSADLRARLYRHFQLEPPAPTAGSGRILRIESADSSQFIGSEAGADGSFIRFSGSVVLSMQEADGLETHTIRADELIYNSEANLLLARGSIRYERKTPGGTDIFMGETLQLDLNDLSGIFLDGKSSKGEGSSVQFAFEAEEILRRGESVLVFKDGIIAPGDSTERYYSIRASRIWILGPKEWAVANATLYVGELPVLYIPFFYYPGQEIVFHPVFGYRDREGRFVQTTTYLLGEKPAATETISLFNLAEDEGGYVRRVEGVFIQNTKEPRTVISSDFIKVLADVYSQLGASLGLQAQLAELGILRSFKADLGLAISRSVFLDGSTYTPFISQTGYQSDWNRVDLFGWSSPLRFWADLSFASRLGPFSLAVALGFYSDPFIGRDFKQRSEDMAWLQFLQQPDQASPQTARMSFNQNFTLQGSIPARDLPSWMNVLSLTRWQASLSWLARESTPPGDVPLEVFLARPSTHFFVPDSMVLADVAMRMGGPIFSYPRASAATSLRPETPGQPGGSQGPEVLPPWAGEGPTESGPTESGATGSQAIQSPDSSGGTQAAEPGALSVQPPGLLSLPRQGGTGGFTAQWSWLFTPGFKWDARFNSAAWDQAADIDWSYLYQLQSLNLSGSTSLAMAWSGDLLKSNLSLAGSSRYQERPVRETDLALVSEALLAAWARQDAQARADSLSASLQLSSSPLRDYWLVAPSSLTWTFSSALYDYRFLEMDGDQPVYETLGPDWSAERIRQNNLRLDLVARPLNFRQSLTMQATLPPLTEAYNFNAAGSWPYGDLSMQLRYYRPGAEQDLEWSPVTARLSLGGAPFPVLATTYVHDLELARPNSLLSRLSWQGFSAELSFARTRAYSLDVVDGWLVGPEFFQPSSLALAYKQEFELPPVWHNRLRFGMTLATDARQSFLRFADATMNFSLSFSLKLHELLDLSFTSVSQNASLWRYYPFLFDLPPEFSDLAPVNPLTDILNGFRFFDADNSARRASLFKLKSLSVKAVHYLHDWNLSFELNAVPYFNPASLNFEFQTNFTVLLAWKAVPEFKTEVKKTGDSYSW